MNRQTANVSLIREQNLSLILHYLLRKSSHSSRADLMRLTSLSGTTVSALVNILLNSGFIHETGVGESIGGRRPITLEVNEKYRYSMGVDIGASHLTVIIIDLRGKPVALQSQHFDVISSSKGTLAEVKRMIQQTLNEAGLGFENLLGIGVTIPTPLDGEKQDRLLSFYMPDWEGVMVMDELRPLADLPIYLENDANAGTIAEKWWGYGKKYHSLAFIKLGIGVGSGLIINNEIYRGYAGLAGEIGHTTIDANGRICRCGNRGCMESYVGIPGILKDVNAHGVTGIEGEVTIEKVIEAALAGNEVCREVIKNAGSYLGIAIANLLNLVNPGIVVMNGVLMNAGDLLMNEVITTMKKRTLPLRAGKTPIVASQLGKDSVAIGAATLVIHKSIQPENVNYFLHLT